MAKVTVYNLEHESVGEIELSDAVFAADVNEGLIYDVLKAQLASRRSGTADTKGRSEVSGSSRKMYKQKGTGRARHGTIRSPVFVGGGQAHGPTPRDYSYRPPRKMRLGALRSALSLKLKEGQLKVVDTLGIQDVKTKKLAQLLEKLQVAKGSLLVDAGPNDNLRLSVRNLSSHQYLPPEGLNLYDLLRHPHLVVTKEAARALEARFGA